MEIRRIVPTITVAAVIVSVMCAATAHAAVIDPLGDFLPSYAGPQNGDLDVERVDARITGAGEVRLVGAHAGDIGTTAGSAYVWGIDRGQGVDVLAMLDPPVGQGVSFDAVAVLFADGTGFVLDLLSPAPPTFLDPSAIAISDDTISATLTQALLPSTGFGFADYGYNLWPRFAPEGVDPLDNAQISDFAPDATTFRAVIPLPGALGLQLAGLAALGAFRLRRALAPAPRA
jgi:hypothetical protein